MVDYDYLYTEPDGFDSSYELEKKYGPGSDKENIIRKIKQEQDSEPNWIKF